MKYLYIGLLILSVSACSSEEDKIPKFRLGTLVERILTKSYGMVVDSSCNATKCAYTVNFLKPDNTTYKIRWVQEYELKRQE